MHLICQAILALVYCAVNMEASTQPAPTPLRVMSVNLRYASADDGADSWKFRREILRRTISADGPDLIGTQEGLAEQVEELKFWFGAFGCVGVGRSDGKEAGEFAAIYFRRSRFDLLDHGHLWLSETPDVPGSVSWDSALTRMATWVRLRDKLDAGREVVFFNTHWDHHGKQARIESAKLIRRKLGEFRAAGLACIFTGDLNADEESPEFKELIGSDDALIDSYRAVHQTRVPDEATFHAFTGRTAGGRIDFVLHSSEFEAVDAKIDRNCEEGKFPSDHYPVVVDLKRK